MSNVVALRADMPSAAAPTAAERGQKVANVDNGFVRTATEIQKAKCRLRLAGREHNVLEAIILSTYGWNKSKDRVTNTYLARLCDLDDAAVSRALASLAKRKIITLEKQGIMKVVGINKHLDEWIYRREPQKKDSKKLVDSDKTLVNSDKKPCRFRQKELSETSNTIDSHTINKDLKPFSSQLAVAHSDTEVTTRVIPDAAVQTPNGKSWGSQDDLTAVQWIYKRVLVNNPTQNTPNWADWANTVRLMRQLDGRTHQDICALFDWASRDEFWRTNVLSPAKLRKHWDTLAARMIRGAPNQGGNSGMVDPEDTSWINGDWGY